MRRYLLYILLLGTLPLNAQQYEKIFELNDLDWGEKTLGQYDYLLRGGAAEVDGYWYFAAYTPENGNSIWKTDLSINGTVRVLDVASPALQYAVGKYLVYYEFKGEYFTVHALDTETGASFELLNGRSESSRFSPVTRQIGDYLVFAMEQDLLIQNLASLPDQDVKTLSLTREVRRIYDLQDHQIFAYTRDGSYKIDIETGVGRNLDESIPIGTGDVRFAGRWADRYYIQFDEVANGNILLMETDLDFSKPSIRVLDTMRNSNLLKLTDEGAILSNYIDGQCTVDLIELPSGNLKTRFTTERTNDRSNWDVITDLPDGGFVLSADFRRDVLYVHFEKDVFKLLTIDQLINNQAYTITPMSKGVLIGYEVLPLREVGLFFYDYAGLQPRRVLEDKSFSKDFAGSLKAVYAAVSETEIMALMEDDIFDYEPAIIDIFDESFYYLKDFNSSPISAAAAIAYYKVLDGGQQLISIISPNGYETVLVDPETRAITKLRDWYDGVDVGILTSSNFGGFNYYAFAEHNAGALSLELGNKVFFIGEEAGQSSGLYELIIGSQSLRRVTGIEGLPVIFSTEENLYVSNLYNCDYQNIPRKLYRLIGDELVLIAEAAEVSFYQTYQLFQYFYLNGKLYFSQEGDLLAYDELSGQIDIIFKDISDSTQQYPGEVMRYGNFIAKDNQLYFTASAESPQLVFGFLFVGLGGPNDYRFVRTDGTVAGTEVLPSIPASIQYPGGNFVNLFSLNGEIFKTIWPEAQEFFRTYRWTDASWQQVEVYEDGVLVETNPATLTDYARFIQKLNANLSSPEDQSFQRIPIFQDGRPWLFDIRPIVNEAGIYGRKLSTISYDGSIRLGNSFFYQPGWDGGYNTVYDSYVLSGNQLYDMTAGGNSIIVSAFDFLSDRYRQIVGPFDALGYANNIDYPTLQSDRNGDVYFAAGPVDGSVFGEVYRLSACSELPIPTSIQALFDTICKGEPLLLSIENAQAFNAVFVKESGIQVPVVLIPSNDIFEAYLDLDPGTYQLSFWIDSGCEEVPLGEFALSIDDERPETPDIIASPTVNFLTTYSTSAEARDYIWIVQNGTLLSGQNTPEILVDWTNVSVGAVGLIVKNAFCESDETFVLYQIATSTDLRDERRFEVYPNPAQYSLTIKNMDLENGFQLKVFTIDGQLIESRFIPTASASLDVSLFPSGTYLMEFQTERGIYRHQLSVIK